MPPRSKAKKQEVEEDDVSMSDAPVSGQKVASTDDDESMKDGAAEEDQGGDEFDEDDEEEEEEDDVQKVRILPGSTPTAASFEFLDEGHTLGNALRWIIMKNPDVEFCAYAIPHPAEAKMNIRIQTFEGTAVEALEKGLRDLQDLADVVTEKFKTAKEEFADRMTS
ncbi:DNA-directed RNA polymerase 1 and 3 polypeptide [Rhypophila sp. PSN 637]